ncbi:hypothetical protein [Bradyrhizobium sp. URHD0069]|uniref:hypothetical protein n=1 Tax=Bradyrhizobium sp. URHD0069 TaxID=1380355 RepID=UPI0004972410|nr:hypothetical protein [Bradyrhizobium sp. URHD0069]
MSVQVKQAIFHHPIGRLFRASLLCLLTVAARAAKGQTAGIEQAFSGSLTAMPSENLGVTGAPQGSRCIRLLQQENQWG